MMGEIVTDTSMVFIPMQPQVSRFVRSPCGAAHHLVEFFEPFRWNEEGNGLPDDLFRGISMNSLRSPVPTGDDPSAFADDGVVGGSPARPALRIFGLAFGPAVHPLSSA
jgi:hypothetical protein